MALLGRVGEQAHPGAVGGAQQGDPAGAEVVELDRVRHPPVPEGAHRAAVGVGDRREGVAVLVGVGHPPVAVVPAGERLPRDTGADPAAARPRDDRPHPQLVAGRAPALGRHRLEQDAERRVVRLEVPGLEDAAEGPLPRRASRRGTAAGTSGDQPHVGIGLAHLDRDGHAVLAVAPHRARAVAGPPGQLVHTGARAGERDESDVRGVRLAPAPTDPPGGLAPVVGQLELVHLALLGVRQAPRDGDGAAHLVEVAVGQLGDAPDPEHPSHLHLPGTAREVTLPVPDRPTVCGVADTRGPSSTGGPKPGGPGVLRRAG